jgi:2-hydroxychromene-2-carboxylate isomerase
VPADRACTLIVAVQMAHGDATAMAFAGDLLRAVWVQDENINDDELLKRKLHDHQLPETLLSDAQSEATLGRYQANTEEALAAGVFGAPSYLCAGALYWGQDRLDFLARQLAK